LLEFQFPRARSNGISWPVRSVLWATSELRIPDDSAMKSENNNVFPILDSANCQVRSTRTFATGFYSDSCHPLPLRAQAVSKRRLTVLVLVAPCASGFVARFCRCFAVSAFCMAVFAGYGRLEAANGSNNGLIQAATACALIAAISGPIPKILMTRLRL
jgi:hypothetical protein